MIETAETREEFERRREKAKLALRAALKGELPLEGVVPVTPVITADSELCDRCKEIQRLRTKRSREKNPQ